MHARKYLIEGRQSPVIARGQIRFNGVQQLLRLLDVQPIRRNMYLAAILFGDPVSDAAPPFVLKVYELRWCITEGENQKSESQIDLPIQSAASARALKANVKALLAFYRNGGYQPISLHIGVCARACACVLARATARKRVNTCAIDHHRKHKMAFPWEGGGMVGRGIK